MPINAPVITRGTVIIKDWLAYLDVTERLERFAQFDVEEILIEALKLNLQHNLDKVVADVLKTTPLVAVPTSASALTITTNGTPSGQAGAKALTYAHIKDAVDYLRLTMQVPPYDGENYACIAHGLGVRVLHDEIGDAFMKYTTPEHFFRSEVGQLYNCRIVQTNNSDALRGSAGTGSIKTPEAIFLAQDPIVEVISVPEEIRIEPVANTMGRKKRLAWFFSGNWALTWDTPGLGEARVIYLTSA